MKVMPATMVCERMHRPDSAAAAVGRRLVYAGLGLELLFASILKTIDGATPTITLPWFRPYIGGIHWQAAIEFGVGVGLLSGVCGRQVRFIARICFACFACVNLFQIFGGAESCGCFGAIKVNPWYTLIANAGAILVLSLGDSAASSAPKSNELLRLVLVLTVGLLCYGLVSNLVRTGGRPTISPVVSANGEVIIEKGRWVGHRLILNDLIDIDADLASGTWIVVIMRSSCAKCAENLPRQELLADELASDGRSSRIAFINIESNTAPDGSGKTHCRSCIYGHIKQGKSLLIETPTIVLVDDGVVTRVLEDLPHRASAFWNSTSR